MNTASISSAIASSLDDLEQALDSLTALSLPAAQKAEALAAIGRARAKLLLPGEPVLLVALAGGSGAGKSSLINALAGAGVAATSTRRPCTSAATVYLHERVDAAVLPEELAAGATFVRHQRPELAHLVLVDTPDLDSFRTEHRAYTGALLQRADLVLYVFSCQNYEDERVWSVLEHEKRFSRAAAVLNKVDLLEPGELTAVRNDLIGSLRRVGLNEAPVFATSAIAVDGAVQNELPGLAEWLRANWREKEITALRARQNTVVLANLRAALAAASAERGEVSVAAIEQDISGRSVVWGGRLVELLRPRWDVIQQAIWPSVMLALHGRLSGPLRTFVGTVDLLRFGVPLLIGRLMGRPAETLEGALAQQLDPPPPGLVQLTQDAASEVGALLFKSGLPVQAWQRGANPAGDALLGKKLADALAAGLRHDWLGDAQPRVLDRVVSFLGSVVPAMVLVWTAYELLRQLIWPPITGLQGWSVLGHAVATCVVWWTLLHLAMLLFDGDQRRLRGTLAPHAEVIAGQWMARQLGQRLAVYAGELKADRERIAEPLARLETAMRASLEA